MLTSAKVPHHPCRRPSRHASADLADPGDSASTLPGLTFRVEAVGIAHSTMMRSRSDADSDADHDAFGVSSGMG